MSRAMKRVVSIVLIVAVILTNAGFSVFAESIDTENATKVEKQDDGFSEKKKKKASNSDSNISDDENDFGVEDYEDDNEEPEDEKEDDSIKASEKEVATSSDVDNEFIDKEDVVATDSVSNEIEIDKIATESDIEDIVSTSSDVNELAATDSDMISTDSEIIEIIVATDSDFPTKTKIDNADAFGSLIDIPDNKKFDMSGNWWLNCGLSGIPKEEINKIEFGKGITINNYDWDILAVVDDGNGGKNYKLLSQKNIGNSVWSWSGDGCRSYYAYPPYVDQKTGYNHEGAAPHKLLMYQFYPTFSDYYKDNMVLMNETEEYWSNGGSSRPTMKPLSTYIRIPVPDEIDWFTDLKKLANGSKWWIMEHVHRADGYIGGEGAAVFPADGNYDPTHGGWSFTDYQRYSASAGVRAVMKMTKDGLKLDPNDFDYVFPSGICTDITNSNNDLLGFAYVINENGGKRLYINMLYDNAIKVTNASSLFSGLMNVTEIKGLDLIDFSNCTNMTSMFEGCNALTTIKFYNNALTNLPNTFGSNVTNISKMFKDCKNLTSVDFLPDDFAINATNMESAFEDTKLSAWPAKLNTTSATNMKRLFAKNNAQIFDFTNGINAFIAANIDVSEMFKDSESLSVITVDANFIGLPNNVTKSTAMFDGCINLAGGEGSVYRSFMNDGVYARVDFGGVAPGYFACTDPTVYSGVEISIESDWKENAPNTSAKKIVFTVENRLLTQAPNLFDMPIKINGVDAIGKGWIMDDDEAIIIHVSDKINGFKTSNDWTGFFEGFTSVESFEGIYLIDTSNVTIMKDVFKNCKMLDVFDLAELDTSNVTTIESMFEGCEEFRGFSGNVSIFSSLENASKAFKGCKSLRTINFTPYIVNTLNSASSMFEDCTGLTSIMVDNNVMSLPNADVIFDYHGDNDMFKNCTKLKGGQGTTYSIRNKIHDKDLACVDYGGIKPGFFSFYDSNKYAEVTFTLPKDWLSFASYIPGFSKNNYRGIKFIRDIKGVYNNMRTIYISDTEHTRFYIDDSSDTIIIHCGKYTPKIKFATDSSGLFKDFANITKIEGLDKVDISDVTNMSEMFSGCSNLQELNLLSFATNTVTDVREMFKDDTSLRTIKASNSFAIRGVTGDDMFLNCSILEGGEGTQYDSANVNSTYAYPDEGPTSANPGYFTWDDGIKFVYNLIYDGNGADGGTNMQKKEGCKEGESVTLDPNTYTRTHYRFLGWSDVSTATSENWKTGDYWYNQDTFSYEPGAQFEDKRIYAVWEKINYTVIYDGNNASGGVAPSAQTGYSGDDLELRTNMGNLWKTGRYLIGWDENQSATTPTYTLGGKMNKTFTASETVTLYAIWGNVPYIIRLNPNGASGDAIDIPAQSDIDVKLPSIAWARSGYNFLAWNTDKNATPINCDIIGEHYGPRGAIVNKTFGANQANIIYNLYAIWEENSTPSPSPRGGGNGGSSGGGGGGPLLDVNRPNTTILPIIKANSIVVVDGSNASWYYDQISNSFKLNVDNNGQKVVAANQFVVISAIQSQSIGAASSDQPTIRTYCFDQKGNMLTGWVGTIDNKWYFFENEKTVLEGSMITGWKKVQE